MSVDLRSVAIAWVSGMPANSQEEGVAQLENFEKALQQRHLRTYFLAPFVSTKDKRETLAESGLSKHVLDLISWIDHKRVWGQLSLLVRQARKHATTLSGKADVTVSSAIPLTDSERSALIKKMEARRSGKVRLHEKVIPQLLGGLVVDMDGTRIDLSIQGKLAAIRAAARATLMHSS
jgi:ATP synthase F1 delta subunit